MLQDLGLAFRSLRRARAFTFAAVATLAIGIGANTIVFTVVDSIALRPLPFGERTDRLVTVHSTHPTQARDWDDSELSYADLVDLRESSESLEGLEGFIERNFSLTGFDETERVLGASVTPGLFALLGIEPARGRGFVAADGAGIGFEPVAILSDALWRRRFGGDPDVIGRGVPINGRSLTIIGVMPPRFAFPERHDLWVPYAASRTENRAGRSFLAAGLLKPGVGLGAARAELNTLAESLSERYPDTNGGWGLHAMPMREFFVGEATRRGLTAMLAAVGLVLLVACANVAGLILARGIGKRRELTLRAALGAGRARLMRPILAESVLLSIAGAVGGTAFAMWGLRALLASNPEPPPYWAAMAIDFRVIAFILLSTAVTALACGIIPAARLASADPAEELHGGRGSGGTIRHRRLQSALVIGQIALSLTLLVGAVLLSQSATRLLRGDGGFAPEPLLSMRFYIAGDAYDDPAARARTVMRLVEDLGAIPGAESAAATGAIPTDDGGAPIRLIPPRGVAAPGEEIGASRIPVTPGFWQTIGAPLIAGRTFSADEAVDPQARVVLVNRHLAETFWPGSEAVGRELRIARPDGVESFRVIGVAPDLVYEELGEVTTQSRMNVFSPYGAAGWRTMALLVRSSSDPASLAGPARQAIRRIDPGFAAYDVMTMVERRVFTHWGERFMGRTFTAFGVAALLLACLGAYGLAAYSVAQRRTEIGVRMALGARRGDVIRLLLSRGAVLAFAGIAIGAPLAVGAAKVVEGMLFEISPWQAGVWIAVPAVLALAVLLATWLPAQRASRTDPIEALRHE